MSSETYEIPGHVSEELFYDLDFYNLELGDGDVQQAWKRVQDSAPEIFWTPHNGGHWVATRAKYIKEVEVDYEHFSHRQFTIPWMDSPVPALPLCLDPPDHGPIRALINPALSPKALKALEARAEILAQELVLGIAAKGECEFVGEFASVMPIDVFLGIVDLPAGDRETLLPWANTIVRGKDAEENLKAQQKISNYLQGWIDERRRNPGDDLISQLILTPVGDKSLNSSELLGLCSLMLVGGLDTVASMMGFIARFLALNPGHRQQLLDEPELLDQDTVIDELMRRHALPNTSRYIIEDYQFGGVQLKQGEKILIPTCLYGLDEQLVDNPLEVDFQRPGPIPHAVFGNGPHRCPGSMLAKREVRIFLKEWLKHIPHFQIKAGTRPLMGSGSVNGMLRLELEWDPA